MTRKLLEVQDLKTYFIRGKSSVKAVDGVSFHVDENETLGLVGESGCGKTMTCLSILRLVPKPARIIGGKIMFDGEDLLSLSDRQMQKVRGEKISMILQDPMMSLNPVFTVGDQISEAIASHRKLSRADLVARTIDILRQVKIPSPEKRLSIFPHQLSGGMKQRVVGAVAISCQPKLLIADEPTTSLDVTIQAQYLELLKDIQNELGMSLIFITHDFGIVANMCNKVAVMYAGQIVESASVMDTFYKPAHHYTASLLKAVPKLETKVDRLITIQGQPPKLSDIPEGCRFSPRCARADELCKNREPQLIEIAPDHLVRCWHNIEY